MKKKRKIILDILPLTRIQLSRNQSFSYLSDKTLGAGTLVLVPFFKRKIEGIVLGNRPDFPRLGNIELKNIDSIIKENCLDNKQLELAFFISDYYFSPLGVVLKSFVPKKVAERVIKNAVQNIKLVNLNIILTNEQNKAVNEITSKQTDKTNQFYLFGPAGSGKTEVYIHSILKLKSKNPDLQFLILLPELTLTPQAIERYSKYFLSKEIVVLNSKISKGKFYSNWNRIKFGDAKLIISSRMGVFAPFKNLGLIVIDEEQDMSFKQWDMSPRYDARAVAYKLAKIHDAKIIYGSATPSIEYFYLTQSKEIVLINIPPLEILGKIMSKKPEVVIVDLKKERWQKNYSSISKKLQSELSYALKNNCQAILFVNRQGMSNFSVCRSCKSVLKCPKCERSLIYDSQGFYKCLHCFYKTSITPHCAKCNGLSFTNIGTGTQKVEREVASIFPSARIVRADSQTLKNRGAQEKIYKDFSERKADIMIGTQMITKGWDLPSISLIGIIDADNLLSVPDLRADERAYQNIVQASGRVIRPGSNFPGSIVIQTFHPENEIIQITADRNFYQLYQREILERKQLKMPPYSRLINLIFQDTRSNKVDIETERLFHQLLNIDSKDIIISDPHSPLLSKIRGRFRKQILIKLINQNSVIDVEFKKIINYLPAGWIIDVDPAIIS